MFLGLPALYAVILPRNSIRLRHLPSPLFFLFCYLLPFLCWLLLNCFSFWSSNLLPLSLCPCPFLLYLVWCIPTLHVVFLPCNNTGLQPSHCFVLDYAFINQILSFLPPTLLTWVFSCVSLSHQSEFCWSQSVSVQLHWLPHSPSHFQSLTTTLLADRHHTTKIFYHQHSSLRKLCIGATGFLLDSWSLRLGPICFLGKSVRNYHFSLCNNPEELRSHVLCGGSLKSHIKNHVLIWTVSK
jgi:hypothetical protein